MSALGECIGAIVGLVAITPGAVLLSRESVFIGFLAIISNIAVRINKKSNIDDTLVYSPILSWGVVGICYSNFFK